MSHDGHDHHGHSHGGDDPPWYRRLMFWLSLFIVAMVLFAAIGMRMGWLH